MSAGALAQQVAAAVLAHPGVARLDGGPFGTVASHLPGRRRVVGVLVGASGEPARVAVVARFGAPLPALADELGAAVRAVLGAVDVEVTISDIVPAGPVLTRAPTGPDPRHGLA